MDRDFGKIRVSVDKNCLHKDKNVYTIGIGLAGPVLEGFRAPFTLVIDTKIVSMEGLEKSATFKKVTEFNKIIEPYGLYITNKDYSSLSNILVYYECLFINLNNNEIKQIKIQVSCIDSKGRNVFGISEDYNEIPLRWDKSIKKRGLEIFCSSAEEMLITETIVDELYNSYNKSVEEIDVKSTENIYVYITACNQNLYDIVSDFPIVSTNSIAIGNDRIFLVLDGRENIGITFSPHEFAHLLINKMLNNEISGADKAFIEGICEYVSEGYRVNIGWMSSYKRALIGMKFIGNVYKCTISEFLKKEIDINREIPFEYYMILPSIIDMLVRNKKLKIKSLISVLNMNESIYNILERLLGKVGLFLEEYEKKLLEENSDVTGKIYELYSQKYYIYSDLSKEISYDRLKELRKKDALLQHYLMCGDIPGASKLLRHND